MMGFMHCQRDGLYVVTKHPTRVLMFDVMPIGFTDYHDLLFASVFNKPGCGMRWCMAGTTVDVSLTDTVTTAIVVMRYDPRDTWFYLLCPTTRNTGWL
eukprot:2894144-Amphidinium_carterae.2